VEQVVWEHRSVPEPRGSASRAPFGPALRVGVRGVADAPPEAGPVEGASVGLEAIGHEAKRRVVREEMQQGVEHADHRAGVASTSRLGWSGATFGFLKGGPRAGPAMRGRIEGIDEPGVVADDGGDAERVVLGADEGLEMVGDEPFSNCTEFEEGRGGE